MYTEFLPNALLYGVPYDLFWHLNPRELEPFRAAYEKKIELYNYNAWLNGVYIQKAISSCFSKASYPKQPYSNKNEENNEKPITDAERFAMFALKYNKNHMLEKKAVIVLV